MSLHICNTIFQQNLSMASLTKLATQETQLVMSNHNWTLFTTIMSLYYILSSFFLSNSFTKRVLAHFIFDNILNKDALLFKQIPCGLLCFFFRKFSILNIWHFFFLDFVFVFVFLSFFSNLSTTSVFTSGVTVSSCCKLSIGNGSDIIKGTRLVMMKTATNDFWFSIVFLYISCLCLNWRIMYTIRNKSSRSFALYFMPHTSGGNSIFMIDYGVRFGSLSFLHDSFYVCFCHDEWWCFVWFSFFYSIKWRYYRSN